VGCLELITPSRCHTSHASVAHADLAVRRVTLPLRTCGYLGGTAFVALDKLHERGCLWGKEEEDVITLPDVLHQFT
jgi:hypothetical protein